MVILRLQITKKSCILPVGLLRLKLCYVRWDSRHRWWARYAFRRGVTSWRFRIFRFHLDTTVTGDRVFSFGLFQLFFDWFCPNDFDNRSIESGFYSVNKKIENKCSINGEKGRRCGGEENGRLKTEETKCNSLFSACRAFSAHDLDSKWMNAKSRIIFTLVTFPSETESKRLRRLCSVVVSDKLRT